MTVTTFAEGPDCSEVYYDTVFMKANKHISDHWVRIGELYPEGVNQPLLPATFTRDHFGQGNHYECFMLTALSTLVRFPDVIQNCFVSKNVRRDGRYTFRFFRGKKWVAVEIDDSIPLEDGEVLYMRSPTKHWWPLLLEKAYAKFYTGYENLEGCTLQEAYHDLTGNPVLSIPIEAKMAKAAGADVMEGHYWLDLAQRIQSGQVVASVLTNDMELENMGLQCAQQYGILEIFSLTGTSSVSDIVIHLHNPFEDEEFLYKGPLNSKDPQWTPKLRARYAVDDARSAFVPLQSFHNIINSMQLCYMASIESEATYFDDEWKGETAGGNPTSVTWRKNPMYLVRNMGTEPVEFIAMIKQDDQRQFASSEDEPKYIQCGLILAQYTYARPIPSFFMTGNNHKHIYKSLFLNAREVSNAVTVPPNSLCYLVPSCMVKGAEGKFSVAMYRLKKEDYSKFNMERLQVPNMNWENPTVKHVEVQMRTRARVDFYVEQATDVHILMHQLKPFVSPKTGGDAMAKDYMGMYLYDDNDRKICGVHAATNFRETGIVYRLLHSGRYAISVTCPRGKGNVPAKIIVVTTNEANARAVEPPADASTFDDEDIIDEGDNVMTKANRIDDTPINIIPAEITEVLDSDTPFEDKRFMIDNRSITNDPWIHIGDLYPEGKTQPLIPDRLSCDQFEQGEHFECCCLTAFATLVDHHPDVIRNLFVTKNVRKDCRYTFQFHRYGQWVKVEIDDRIPMTGKNTLYCRSPSRHWWPLLLEKAYAKFYTMYQNIEGCSPQEFYHDFTGRPVVSISMDAKLPQSGVYDIHSLNFWQELNNNIGSAAYAAVADTELGEELGFHEGQAYGVLGIITLTENVDLSLSDLFLKLHNPFVETVYTGPMNKDDKRWTPQTRTAFEPERRDVIYIPVTTFCDVFATLEKLMIKGYAEPSWHFNSEWGEKTCGGNPTLVTWRENPLYVVRNSSDEVMTIIAMISQPDQRHLLHHSHEGELKYIQCGLVLSQNVNNTPIPTYLLTANNHHMVHKGLYLNSREVANVIEVPPHCLAYLVPSAMFHERGKFLLSYWYMNRGDEQFLSILRLRVDVARHLPAIAHVELQEECKERVDFIVDAPTDVHILLRQEKLYRAPNCSDAMTEDYLGMYLYDNNNARLSGVSAATNFRETGIVHHLESAGHYVLSITCPRATGQVPARVEVVALEAAHVRITEPPVDAPAIYNLSRQPSQAGTSQRKPEHRLSTRAVSRGERESSLSMEIEALNDLAFLDPEPEGIPIADIPLRNDHIFLALANERFQLKYNPEANANELEKLEARMNARAHELAKEMHVRERTYLDPEPEGIPLELLSLNDDAAFSKMEDDLRALNREIRKDPKAITNLENKLNDRAHELAIELVNAERDLFLEPKPEGVPIADVLLAADDIFHSMEVERLRLRKEDPRANAEAIKDLEKKMNDRAAELSRKKLEGELAFLEKAPYGIPMNELGLACDDEFKRKTMELMNLRKDPKKNAEAVKALEDKLLAMERDVARGMAALDRKFLDPEPEGRLLSDLPLDDDKTFVDMDTKRRLMIRSGAVLKKVQALEEEMNDRVHEIARSLNAKERPAYLKPAPLGVPLENLPLDLDEKFRELEATRQQLKRDLNPNMDAIADVEAALNARSEELAAKKLSDDRGYLDPEPEGVPLRLLSLDTDGPFMALESKRAQLKTNPERNAKTIRDLESDLNDRARDLANELKQAERATFLDPKPLGIPIGEVPIDDDDVFRNMEIKRLLLGEDLALNADAMQELEGAMNERAAELAGKLLAAERTFLDPEPLGLPLEELSLNDNQEFRRKEDELRELRKKRQGITHDVQELMQTIQDAVYVIAADELDKLRATYLDPEYAGRLLCELGLNDDMMFIALEKDFCKVLRNPNTYVEDINALKTDLIARVYGKAKKLNASERSNFLEPCPLGVPLEDLPLDTDKEFADLEAERARLKRSPEKNRDAIAKVEKALNARARELAEETIRQDRVYLSPAPEGVPVSFLPLDTDPMFQELERQRALVLSTVPFNARALCDIENKLNSRAHEIALDYLKTARSNYIKDEDLPLSVEELTLDDDLPFREMEARRFELLAGGDDKNHLVFNVEEALQKRAEELGDLKKEEHRLILNQAPLGVPLRELMPDKDALFLQKEAELRRIRRDPLKSAEASEKLGEVNTLLNDMAIKEIEARYPYLDKKPEGVSLRYVPFLYDLKFAAIDNELTTLRKDPILNQQKIEQHEKMLNERVHELAKKVKEDGRQFLEPFPEHIPLDYLPLDEDKKFTDTEEQRRQILSVLSTANQKKLQELEADLQQQVYDLAKIQKEKEREFLDPMPEGIPLSQLQLDDDAEFMQLTQQRRKIIHEQPRSNTETLQSIQTQMNDRAHQLAKKKKMADRGFLDQTPEGVPLAEVPLDDDAEFLAMEEERKKLAAGDARKNAQRIADLEERMNDRVHELAEQKKMADRGFLDQTPEGVLLAEVRLDDDAEFLAMEEERKKLVAGDARKNAQRIADLEERMNDRVHELAEQKKMADRGFLDQTPEGVLLAEVRLDDDAEFLAMEEERKKLAAGYARKNAQRIADLEERMNDRARELAAQKKMADRGFMDQKPVGVPLAEVPLDDDAEFLAMEEERKKLVAGDARKNAQRIADLEERMNDRVHELAQQKKMADRGFLDQTPEGVLLAEVRLDDDAEFLAMEEERKKLAAGDARKNAQRIADLEERMNDRVHELAEQKKMADRGFLDQTPEGVLLAEVRLDDDAEFLAMEEERKKLAAGDARKNAQRIADLEERMNDRVHELAEQKKMADRGFLDQTPEGVLLAEVRLDDDAEFLAMEEERKKLAAGDARKNAQRIADLEERMNDRAHELAEQKKMADRAFMDPKPAGVPLAEVSLDDDAEFLAMEEERKKLVAGDARKNAQRIADLEERMNDRAHELAEQKKMADRGFLDPKPAGVPLAEVPLDDDAEFLSMEEERKKLVAGDARKNAQRIAELEERMNDRAYELAEQKKMADRAFLDPKPAGVPLAEVPLDDDAEFLSMEEERKRLVAGDPRKNAQRIAELEKRMNDRAHELAEQKKMADRGFMDQKPVGVPLAEVPLDDDAEFLAMEEERKKLVAGDPRKNAQRIAELEERMNDRAYELAEQKKMADRAFLDPKPAGVPLAEVPLDDDAEFLSMEEERKKLVAGNPRKNAQRITELEERMNDRAYELAEQKKMADRAFLDPKPAGVPLAEVPLDDDAEFLAMEEERKKLVAGDPRKNAQRIAELEERMNDRAYELAEQKKMADRAFLDPKPAGVPLAEVPLDDDAEFLSMEEERKKLVAGDPRKNAQRIAELEERMNDRAHELAEQKKMADRGFMDQKPVGVPLAEVPLDDDAEFLAMEEERKKLVAGNPRKNAQRITELEERMNDRAHELAEQKKMADRAFLDPKPAGVPLAEVLLDDDAEFLAMEEERKKLVAGNPRKNAQRITELEERMNDRAYELAEQKKMADRAFLDPKPAGIPLVEVPLDDDAEFLAMEEERKKLVAGNPRKNAQRITELEERMRDRARELAEQKKVADRGFLDKKSEGVPLAEVPLDDDAEFLSMEEERKKLVAGDAVKNAQRIAELEGRMNDRVQELAEQKKMADRGFLDQKPAGVPLAEVPLDDDAEFLAMEEERKRLVAGDPRKNAQRITELEERMNDRAHELAEQKKMADRGFLDKKSEGVPLAEVPLDDDAEFLAMEEERKKLVSGDAVKNAQRIADLEERMRDRARELAEQKKMADRGFMDQTPEGVPLAEVPLDNDAEFLSMEEERKKLVAGDAFKNAQRITELEVKMNDRAHVLARKLLSNDRAFLNPEPRGVPLELLPLSTDSVVTTLARRLRCLRTEDRMDNAEEIAELEKEIAERIDALAKDYIVKVRADLDQFPEGIPLSELPLDDYPVYHDLEKTLFQLKKNSEHNAEMIKDQQYAMNDSIHNLAKHILASDRDYLNKEAQGIPIEDLSLNEPLFHEIELERYKLKNNPERNAARILCLESTLKDRADELARLQLAEERAFLDSAPEGVPLERLPLNTDQEFHKMEKERRALLKGKYQDPKKLSDLEERMRERVRILALASAGCWEDEQFHAANKDLADKWPRIGELYPEGARGPVVPEHPEAADVASGPRELGYLAPFFAAMSLHPPLIQRLFDSKTHPASGPYMFNFFDSGSNPVRVDIDDRVPVNANMEPKFTTAPRRSWWPLLLEKAYAKFVGGYAKLDQCTPNETLRDLTGRPVTHIPFEDKRADGIKMGDFRSVTFWRGISADLAKGDIITALSNADVPDGIHQQCCYAVWGVIQTVKESNDPSDVVIKLHNCYQDAPFYDGPLNKDDPYWSPELKAICGFHYSQHVFLYLPLPVLLQNFSSMQRCHINCGDRLTVVGEWEKSSAGGNPKFTTFRSNPIYLVENRTSRPATILSELRHHAPVFYDADRVGHYHQTGLALLRPDSSTTVVSGLVTNATHKFIQKGIMLDTREVCSRMELPPNSTSYLIPYTLKRGSIGMFSISVYPGNSDVNLTPLRPFENTQSVVHVNVTLKPGSREGERVSFTVTEACDVHLLLRQNKITDPSSVKKGDIIAEDDVVMMIYDSKMSRLATTGDATSAREHALALSLPVAGHYTVLMMCPNKPLTGNCPCLLMIYTPKRAGARIVPQPANGPTSSQLMGFSQASRSSQRPNRMRVGNGNDNDNDDAGRRDELQKPSTLQPNTKSRVRIR